MTRWWATWPLVGVAIVVGAVLGLTGAGRAPVPAVVPSPAPVVEAPVVSDYELKAFELEFLEAGVKAVAKSYGETPADATNQLVGTVQRLRAAGHAVDALELMFDLNWLAMLADEQPVLEDVLYNYEVGRIAMDHAGALAKAARPWCSAWTPRRR